MAMFTVIAAFPSTQRACQMDDVKMDFRAEQYEQALSLKDSIAALANWQMFFPYRPKTTPLEDPKAWWRYGVSDEVVGSVLALAGSNIRGEPLQHVQETTPTLRPKKYACFHGRRNIAEYCHCCCVLSLLHVLPALRTL